MGTLRTPVRFAAFLCAVALTFAAAVLVGRLVGPIQSVASTASAPSAPSAETPGHGHDAAEHAPATPATAGHAGGLAITQDEYTLRPLAAPQAPGAPAELAFRIVGPAGAPVTSYVSTHERPLHLIVVRRDLVGYQHLHPSLDADGTWRTPLTLPAAGSYRLFADFAPDGRTDSITLGTDIAVPGPFAPQALPAPSTVTDVDGYTVRLTRGTAAELAFTVERAGAPVTDLEPYLGALGHLVMLRTGDLAYLHTHPAVDRLAFAAEPPSPGTYRLYMEFKHGGAVHTAAFTVEEQP